MRRRWLKRTARHSSFGAQDANANKNVNKYKFMLDYRIINVNFREGGDAYEKRLWENRALRRSRRNRFVGRTTWSFNAIKDFIRSLMLASLPSTHPLVPLPPATKQNIIIYDSHVSMHASTRGMTTRDWKLNITETYLNSTIEIWCKQRKHTKRDGKSLKARMMPQQQ